MGTAFGKHQLDLERPGLGAKLPFIHIICAVALNLGLLSALDMAAFRSSGLPVSLVMENAFGRSGGVLIAFIAADPMSGVYMAVLIAVCVPVGFILHRRRRAGEVSTLAAT